jgi:hypothetical protein
MICIAMIQADHVIVLNTLSRTIPLLNILKCIAKSMNTLALGRSIGMEDFPLAKT